MNTTNIAIVAGLFAVLGKWAKNESLNPRIAVGTFVVAMGLSSLHGVDAGLARDFALLILAGSILYNGPAVFESIGRAVK